MSLADRFSYHVGLWHAQTAALSSTTKIVENFHYREIISMGLSAITLIVKEMRKGPDHWFEAINSILGIEPKIPEKILGRMQELTDHYLKWLEKSGLIVDDPADLAQSIWNKNLELRGHVKNLIYWASAGESALDSAYAECDRVVMAAEEAVDIN